MATVLGTSAPMGAGSSDVIRRAAESLNVRYASFGKYVSKEADKRGLAISRETLQDLGQSLVDSDVQGFCSNVLQECGWQSGTPLVIDGVRHLRVLDALKTIVEPCKFAPVFLNIGSHDTRWTKTELPHTKPLDQLAKHPTEHELAALRERAGVIISCEQAIDKVIGHIEKFVRLLESGFNVDTSWDQRNRRRLELIEKDESRGLCGLECDELELLQHSFTEYVETRFEQPVLDWERLEHVESHLRGTPTRKES